MSSPTHVRRWPEMEQLRDAMSLARDPEPPPVRLAPMKQESMRRVVETYYQAERRDWELRAALGGPRAGPGEDPRVAREGAGPRRRAGEQAPGLSCLPGETRAILGSVIDPRIKKAATTKAYLDGARAFDDATALYVVRESLAVLREEQRRAEREWATAVRASIYALRIFQPRLAASEALCGYRWLRVLSKASTAVRFYEGQLERLERGRDWS